MIQAAIANFAYGHLYIAVNFKTKTVCQPSLLVIIPTQREKKNVCCWHVLLSHSLYLLFVFNFKLVISCVWKCAHNTNIITLKTRECSCWYTQNEQKIHYKKKQKNNIIIIRFRETCKLIPAFISIKTYFVICYRVILSNPYRTAVNK